MSLYVQPEIGLYRGFVIYEIIGGKKWDLLYF